MGLDRWIGKVALVTGASSGIGYQVVKDLAKEGLVIVAAARRIDKLRTLKEEIEGDNVHIVQCDVNKEDDVQRLFDYISKTLGGIDILINNAGASYDPAKFVTDTSTEEWRTILETNVLAVAVCTREALKVMRPRGDDGIIININSRLGHMLPENYQKVPIGMYVASKHGVTAFTKCLREELKELGSKIRVTSLSPGVVKTELVDKTVGSNAYSLHMIPEDISDAVKYILGTRPWASVTELTIAPSPY